MSAHDTPALWFFDHGIGVFPLRARRKEPACESWDDYTCTREQAARLRQFGVRLSATLGVLDTDNREAELWVLRQIIHRAIPDTPFLVETARGFHRYYQLAGALPNYLHRDGHTIEFRNVGQYVVGPGSVHPGDVKAGIPPGKKYQALGWSWRWEDLPFFPVDFQFDDRAPEARGTSDGEPYEFPDVVRAGERHDQLFRLLRSCKGKGWDRNETREVATLANQYRCDPPLTEDSTFERWFERAWNNPDRPFNPRPLSGLRELRGL